MTLKNIKMIVTDLDKSLLRNDKTISEYTKSILNRCHEKGIFIVFATARPERATRQWQIDSMSCYVIANNGATITHGGKEVQDILIDEITKHSIIKQFLENEDIKGICVETGSILYTDDKSYSTWGEIYPADTGWNPVFHNFRKPIEESVCKLSVECAIPEVVLKILHDYPELRVFPNNGELWYQITHKSASKYNAITHLAKLTDIALHDIIAFGDDYNDVEMLEKCGVGVAVENAVFEAKKAADYTCDTNDNDGVAKWIEQRIL